MRLSLEIDDQTVDRLFDAFDVDAATRADANARAEAAALIATHLLGAIAAGEEPVPADTRAAIERAMLDIAGAEHRSEASLDDIRGVPTQLLLSDAGFVDFGDAPAGARELESRLRMLFDTLQRRPAARRMIASRRLLPTNEQIEEVVITSPSEPVSVIAAHGERRYRFEIDPVGALIVGSLTEPPEPVE